MKYTCEHCGRSFDTATECREHEASCILTMAETVQAVQLVFDIGDKVIDVSTREMFKSATLDPADVFESADGEGWHVVCMPGDVKKAVKALASHVVEELDRRMCRLRDAKTNVLFSESLILADECWDRPGDAGGQAGQEDKEAGDEEDRTY